MKKVDQTSKTFKLWKKDWLIIVASIPVLLPIFIWGIFLVVLEAIVGWILRRKFSI